jgi:hypothetical protein
LRHSNASFFDERCQLPLTNLHPGVSIHSINIPLLPPDYLIAHVLEKDIRFDLFFFQEPILPLLLIIQIYLHRQFFIVIVFISLSALFTVNDFCPFKIIFVNPCALCVLCGNLITLRFIGGSNPFRVQ